MRPKLRIGSLCSGYGGLDLGTQAVIGGTVAWHVENDKDASKILDHHWPDVPNLGDLTTIDWAKVEPVDVITAGYPCQPFSHAGERKGTTDERHLWPFVAGAIGALRPRLVVLENVRGHVSLGLDAVIGDLSSLGYDAQWRIVRASDVGAPHGRARLFIVAADTAQFGHERTGSTRRRWSGSADSSVAAARTTSNGRHEGRAEPARVIGRPDAAECGSGVRWGIYEPAIRRWERLTRPAPEPTQSSRKGTPQLSPAFSEWMQGLPAGHVTDVPISRNAQLKALGNGVVPQQAALALRLLLETAAVA